MTSATPSPGPAARPPALVAFGYPAFTLLWFAKFCATFATQVISVAVGWQVYDITRNPLDLGLVGLAQFAPAIALVLVTGSAADRHDRKRIVALCLGAEIACAAALLALTLQGNARVWPILAVLLGFGTARAFFGPASQAILPNLVAREHLPNALAFNSTGWQIATILGPVAGGLLYGLGAATAYGTAAGLMAAALVLVVLMRAPPQPPAYVREGWADVVAGFRYIWRARIILGAISLDLFAVLLSGATALMPAFARDILHAGPEALGLLRAAPGIGAVAMALWLAAFPIRDHAGAVMFWAVALFGLVTAIFGLSTTLWLSVACLVVMGAADMISVWVREILVQANTPDAVRGRVNAVNMVFVGASNELGEFRAGTMAALIGVVPAVVFGGLGAIAVAGLWAWLFPELRRARRLDGT
ncbi:MAG: MFS transporter [Rhodobacteraceae bacterium]|nr:MFS transporter [Paracoccaceae bacterium]